MKIQAKYSIRLLMFSAFVLLTSCTEKTATPPTTSQAAPAAEAQWSGTKIRVQGTAEKPLPEGFTRIEANCIEWQDAPSMGPLVAQVPETWGVTKKSSGPRKGDIGLKIGRVGMVLSARLQDKLRAAPDIEPAAGDYKVVGSVHWSGATHPVYFGNSNYVAYLPVLSADETTDVYAIISLGKGRAGEIENISREEVLTVFGSLYLDRCVAESYAKIFNKVDVSFVDEAL